MTVPLPPPPAAPEPDEPWPTKAQARLIAVILALTLAAIAYRVVYATGYQHTAALYIGVPAVLALALAAAPRSRSATGMLIRGSLLGLLLAGIILPEGLICLVMAAPLVLLVAIVVGVSVDVTSRRQQQRRGPTLMVVALPLLLLSGEGVVGSPVDPHERATATVVVAAPVERVATDLAAPPRFVVAPSGFLAFGFNRPLAATSAGLEVGDERMIEFTGGTHDDHPLRLWGGTGEPSTDHHSHMVLRVAESRPGRVVFALMTDTTMLARWVRLTAAEVTWQPEPGADRSPATRITLTFHYERLLQPSWYFGPLERYGMDRAAAYLLDALVAEPAA